VVRWLLPEWHPWFRDWSDVLRLSFLLAVPPLLVFDPPEALRLFLTFAVSLIPRLTATPAAFDLGFNAAWSLQAWGNVSHVFGTWLGYHDIVHFSLTGATAALFYFVLQRLRLLPDLAAEQTSTAGAPAGGCRPRVCAPARSRTRAHPRPHAPGSTRPQTISQP
jgi:hypothetical protein